MKRIVSFVAPVMALVLAMAFSQMIRAEDKPATAGGTVEVTVQDKDGKPVEGATVRVTEGKAGGNKAKTAKLADAPAAGEKPARPAPIAESKTGADGKAKLENVPAGDYNLAANLKGQGSARQKITVKAGETVSVELKLAARGAAA